MRNRVARNNRIAKEACHALAHLPVFPLLSLGCHLPTRRRIPLQHLRTTWPLWPLTLQSSDDIQLNLHVINSVTADLKALPNCHSYGGLLELLPHGNCAGSILRYDNTSHFLVPLLSLVTSCLM